ncbi:MAG: T9SS type A sorting domain-containing protein [Bacteroidales bacterium]|nr:T9SS type A sorting domain-containing protein [Bacteroidales bacterium]
MIRRWIIVIILLLPCEFRVAAQYVGGSKPIPTAMVVDSLPSVLGNTSSLFYWQDGLWTINDHGGLVLYQIDTLTADVLSRLPDDDTLPPFSDMEATTQDDSYFYFGDFGNNHEHLRSDLRILRLAKSDLLRGCFRFDTIFFTYPGYDPSLPGRDGLPVTDYDCEAMIAASDSLFLFTKQWTSLQTTCYALPNQPGRFTATQRGTADVSELVTGACYLPEQRLLVFSCYSVLCQPFVHLLYDFRGTDFFGGEQLRLPLSNAIGTQIEAIASADGLHYYLTNERFSRYSFSQPAQLLSLDLTDYLYTYLYPDTSLAATNAPYHSGHSLFSLSPNPASHYIEVACHYPNDDVHMAIYDTAGRLRQDMSFHGQADTLYVDLSPLYAGIYLFFVTSHSRTECHTIVVQ